MNATQIRKALLAAGIRYNPDSEEFERDGHPVEIDEVETALPGLTLDEIASYADAKYDARRKLLET